MNVKNILVLLLLCLILASMGCQAGHQQVLASSESQVKLRIIQTRAFDTTDKIKTLRTVIATLQDLGFVILKADDVLGSVTGSKLEGYAIRITVTVRPRGKTQLLVRANAQFNIYPIEDPKPYQQFFQSLEKSMFLTAHNID